MEPGEDLLTSIKKIARENEFSCSTVISCCGSIEKARIRVPNGRPLNVSPGIKRKKLVFDGTDESIREEMTAYDVYEIDGPLEITSMGGSISKNGDFAHLHVTLVNGACQVFAGHLLEGNPVYTTVELNIASYPNLEIVRDYDKRSKHTEIVVREKK